MTYPRALLAAYAVVVVLALVVAGTTSSAAFGAYNPAWDGASDLRSEAEAAGSDPLVVRNTTTYREGPPTESVAVVLSPEQEYSDREATHLRRFVRAGGTLVVAEDYGPHSNDLLAAVGAAARVDGRPLRDERHNYRSPAMPVATNVTNTTRVGGADQLTLNHGTAVEPNGADVLVATSGFAYLDGNHNGDLDDEETMASYPVVTTESVGDGTVVVVGDPSALINVMLEQPGNQAFVRSLFAGSDRVLLDYSHAGALPPLSAARLAIQRSPLGLILVGLGIVVGVAAWRRRIVPAHLLARLPGPDVDRQEAVAAPDAEELAASLTRSHPEWDRERVQQVVEAATDDNRVER